MKKLLFLIAAVSTMLIGCAESGDMTSEPATTNAAPAAPAEDATTTTNE